ncbi:oligosaccharide flippase family protein [Microbulbifer sp. SSSA002]|uniref:oligosaccharide flippase family protein n=1 Tax=unclassified Microbulbifer TaxID=2619833 RepID=UPI0040391952
MQKDDAWRALLKALPKSIGGRYLVYLAQLISIMTLARLFSPEEYGVFAAMQVFIFFFQIISELGVVPAIINEKEISLGLRDGVFTLTFFSGITVGVVFWLIYPFVGLLYEMSFDARLAIPLALSVFFGSLSVVPLAILQREHFFLPIAYCEFWAEIISLMLVFVLFLFVDTILILAFRFFILSVLKFCFFWVACLKSKVGEPRFGGEFYLVRSLFKFSCNQMGFNIANFFSRSLDNLLVGRYFGASGLGVYERAYGLMRYPLMLITFAMNPAIQPVLTNSRDDLKKIEYVHNLYVRKLSLVAIIVGVGVYLYADVVVAVVLGSQWREVIPVLKILALSLPVQIVLSSSGSFFHAAARPDLLFKLGVFSCFTNCVSMGVGIWFGSIETLCWALLCSFSVNFFICYFVMGFFLLPSGFLGVLKSLKYVIYGEFLFVGAVLFL